jgi:putative ABC transport system permease protein
MSFALRQLLKNPGFTAVAVLTLALGIGANTAIFSLLNAVVLKALPYTQPDRLVMVWTDNASMNIGFHELPPSPPDIAEWRNQAHSFEQIAAFRTSSTDLSERGEPERVGGVQVTANFFSLLGVHPTIGRTFNAEEETPGQDKVAIISHSLWQRHWGGESNILDQFITVNGERCAVIGIMPPEFHFPRGAEMPVGYALMNQTDVWRPYAAPPAYWNNGDARDFIAMGRLKGGVSLRQAQAEMNVIARAQAEAHPKTHAGWTIHLRPLAIQLAGKARPVLFMLFGAVAFVLLIACANVANLLLCRAAARRKEMAVRAALGATRAHLLRQLLTESVLLSLIGGGLGVFLGAWGVRIVLLLAPSNLPHLEATVFDGRVLAFTLLISLATGILFGLAPAWESAKTQLSEVLNADTRGGTAAHRHRTHGWLVMSEVALVVVLLTGAGLMFQSFLRLQAVDPGFKPQRVAAFDVGLKGAKYASFDSWRQFYRETRQRLSNIPGVRAAAAISNLPLGGIESITYFHVEGVSTQAGQEPIAENRKITPGYFETLGVPLQNGRDFTDTDRPDQPTVCIINETLARSHFPGVDPVNKRLKIARVGEEEEHSWFTVIGVAQDVRSYGLEVPPRAQIYTSVEQNVDNEMSFVVRADTLSAASLERAIRTEMKGLDPSLPLANVRTMESLVTNALARPRFSTFLLGLFAGTALLLTVVGLYGVVAYASNQRTREIGIRMALGATTGSVLGLIIRQGMRPALIGLGIGVAAAFALTRLLANQLYQVKPTDPITFLGVIVVLLVVALAACFLPARRAAATDPIEALREF